MAFWLRVPHSDANEIAMRAASSGKRPRPMHVLGGTHLGCCRARCLEALAQTHFAALSAATCVLVVVVTQTCMRQVRS
jgi:hypothetical protein